MKHIQRHSALARSIHWVHVGATLTLFVTGLFIFVPAIGEAVSADTFTVTRALHRAAAILFIVVPLLGIVFSPGGFRHFAGNLFRSWDADDKEFMKKFIPYLFSPKKTHMPKQHELKSGQMFADWFILLFAVGVAVSGLFMWRSETFSAELIRWMYIVHDVSMIGLGVFLLAHAYLGAGIFQPYRGSLRLMFGDGKIAESDARYHWGHWADEELAKGDNVTEA
jgi:formate dehydrogenase subunit gamma